MKEAIEAFQVKISNDESYLIYWVRKTIPMCFDAITTSPIESINNHIHHKTKANSLNYTSRSLMMITDSANTRISEIEKVAQLELQLTGMSS